MELKSGASGNGVPFRTRGRKEAAPRRRDGLVIVLLVLTLLGIGLLWGTTRMRAAYEAREEATAKAPVRPVVDLHTALP
jgi:hypothetical protein